MLDITEYCFERDGLSVYENDNVQNSIICCRRFLLSWSRSFVFPLPVHRYPSIKHVVVQELFGYELLSNITTNNDNFKVVAELSEPL